MFTFYGLIYSCPKAKLITTGPKCRLIVSVVYHSTPYNGVKAYPEDGYPYVPAIREQRPYKNHPSQPLYKTSDIVPCPEQFAYIYPDDFNDH